MHTGRPADPRRKRVVLVLALVGVAVGAWVWANPPGRFGWCRYAVTTFNSVPRLISDMQIAPDGSRRKIAKTHQLTLEHVQWLLDSKPEVLIVAIGWDGVTQVEERIQEVRECEIHVLRNREAIDLYNRLKASRRKVAIHYHSTC